LRSACENVRALLDRGVQPEAIGIVARSLDSHDVQLLNRQAGHFGFSSTIPDTTMLVAHRIGRGVVTLLRLRERGFLRSEVMELIRDGFVTRTRLDVDAVDVRTRRAHIAGGSSSELRSIRNRAREMDDSVVLYISLIEELEAITDFAGRPWSEVLSKVTGMFRIETAGDGAAIAALDGVTSLLHRAERTKMRLDAGAVIDAIEQCELRGALQPGPTIWLGDVMKLRGRTFEHLFVIRMQDDLFPQRRVEDPLLPDIERRAAGIREIGNGRDEEHLLFHLMLNAAEASVRFSFSGTDGFGKPLRPSQLLKNFAIERDPDRRRDILHDFPRYVAERNQAPEPASRLARPAPPRRTLQLLARAGRGGVFDGYVGPRDRFTRALQAVSPTQLEDFGECPQKFLLKHLLGVRDLEDPEREVQINARDKGSLDHRILERFYRQLRVEELDVARHTLPRLPAALTERLEAAIDEEFDAMEAEAPAFNATVRGIERRAARRNLRDFVALDLSDLLEKGLRPRFFEYKFGPKYQAAEHPGSFIVQTRGLPLRVDGSIDRIDTDGRHFRIVDYKSGKALRHQNLGKKLDRGVRLQLALYAMAVAEFFDAPVANVSGTIKPLISGSPGRFEFELGEKQVALTETLDIFVAAISSGIFPAFPNEGERTDDFDSCKYCPVNHSCRTRHDLDEKVAIRAARDPRTLLMRLVPDAGDPALSRPDVDGSRS
ncbi:MAG: PD-(D/E)XK nuclease family protein, partial [Acidobacteriota bacterium]